MVNTATGTVSEITITIMYKERGEWGKKETERKRDRADRQMNTHRQAHKTDTQTDRELTWKFCTIKGSAKLSRCILIGSLSTQPPC